MQAVSYESAGQTAALTVLVCGSVVAWGNVDVAHNSKSTHSTPNVALKKALRSRCSMFAMHERNTSVLCGPCHQSLPAMYLPPTGVCWNWYMFGVHKGIALFDQT